MKKLLIASLLGACATTAVHAAIDPHDVKPYIGAGYTYLNSDSTDFHFLGLNAGLQLNDYLGVEAFWNKTVNNIDGYYTDGTYIYKGEFDLQYYGIGVTGQYPLANNFYVKGLLGYARADLNVDVKYNGVKLGSADTKDNGVIVQAGLGYNILPNLAAEANYTYLSSLDNFNGVNLQVKYKF